MTSANATKLIKAVKKAGASTLRIGTGSNVTVGIYGDGAEQIAKAVEKAGYVRTEMSGDGSGRLNPITFK